VNVLGSIPRSFRLSNIGGGAWVSAGAGALIFASNSATDAGFSESVSMSSPASIIFVCDSSTAGIGISVGHGGIAPGW
jgi:hypothetical protein